MMLFNEFFFKMKWIDLYELLKKGRFEDDLYDDPNYHQKLIDALNNVGLKQEAQLLNTKKIPEELIEFGKNPYLKGNIYSNYNQLKKDHEIAFNQYMDELDKIIKIVYKKLYEEFGQESQIDMLDRLGVDHHYF
jgi:hypothetical protein